MDQPSPQRNHRGIDGDMRDCQSCSQSQGDESGINGDEITEEASSVRRGRIGGKAERSRGQTSKKRAPELKLIKKMDSSIV